MCRNVSLELNQHSVGKIDSARSPSCAWTAASTAPWITIVSDLSGVGAGVVGVSASANPESATRTGTVTVGGQAFTVTQSGDSLSQTIRNLPIK